MNIMTSKASIEAAISTMHPVAAEAAKLLAHRMLESPKIMQSESTLRDEWIALLRSLGDTRRNGEDDTWFESFMENHGKGVANVAISIVVFLEQEAERKRKWGWIGTAAAALGGAALGIFFS